MKNANTIKIERKKLETLVKKAMVGTKKTNLSPIESCIRIKVEKDVMTVYAINDRFSVTVWDVLDLPAEEPFDCVIDAKMFFDLISKMTSNEVTFEKKSNIIRVKDKKIKLDIPTLSSDLWPERKEMGEEALSFPLDAKAYEVILGCTHALKKDSSGTPLMASIHLEVKNEFISAIALDGYRVSIRKSENDFPKDGKPININGDIFIKSLQLVEADEKKIFSTDGNYFQIESERAQIIGSIDSNPYFNVTPFIGLNDYSISVKLDRKELLDALGITLLIRPEVDLAVYEDHIVLSAQSSISTKSVIQIPAVVTGKDLDIRFNGKFLTESLKSIADDTIQINFMSPLKPFFIVGEEGNYKEIILPIKKC